jgi:predicted histidine transporter YuiF (NhaC family)
VGQLMVKANNSKAFAGFLFLSLGGVIRRKDFDDIVTSGFKIMQLISFALIGLPNLATVCEYLAEQMKL